MLRSCRRGPVGFGILALGAFFGTAWGDVAGLPALTFDGGRAGSSARSAAGHNVGASCSKGRRRLRRESGVAKGRASVAAPEVTSGGRRVTATAMPAGMITPTRRGQVSGQKIAYSSPERPTRNSAGPLARAASFSTKVIATAMANPTARSAPPPSDPGPGGSENR